MDEQNNPSGGVGNFLNEITQQQAVSESQHNIVSIDIDDLLVNKQNFYGMRNIEELASMISVTHNVDPLTVAEPNEEGKYLLLAGHRRLAAWKQLLEKGVVTDHTLPCIVLKIEPMHFTKADGTEVTFDTQQMQFFYLMFSNMGQRKERTIYEQLQEIRSLEPFARAVYDEKLKDKDVSGPFRKFFAQNVLRMSSSALQRKLALEKLTKSVIEAIQDGTISETAAGSLVNLSEEEQDKYIEQLRGGEVSGKVLAIKQETGQAPLPSEEEEPQEDEFVEEEPAESDGEGTEEPNEGESMDEPADEPPAPSQEPYEAPENEAPAQAEPKPAAPPAPKVSRIPIPQDIGDPQQEANRWWDEIFEVIYNQVHDAEEQQRIAQEEGREADAAQWGIRIAVAQYKIARFKEIDQESK